MFKCRIDGDPYPKVEWSKGKWRKIENNHKTRVYKDEATGQHVCEMDNCKGKDAGTYTVTISNHFATEACPATLMITKNAEEVEDWAASLKKTYAILS